MSLKSLELLLADEEEGGPVLHQGLALDALQSVWAPGSTGVSPAKEAGEHLDLMMHNPPGGGPSTGFHADPDDLRAQGWGLVVPEGPKGEELLAWIEPLRRARQEALGRRPVRVYRAPAKLDGPGAARWKKHVFRNDARDETAQPRYLLLLGDLDQMPLEVQQVLSTDSFVGRLALRTEAEYAAYIAKVLRWESALSVVERARLLFFTSQDGTSPTKLGYEELMAPNLEACQRSRAFSTMEIREVEGKGSAALEQLLAQAAEPGPAVLFSLSHGLSAAKDRRGRQGALVLPRERLLTAADVAAVPFLPGGIWFCFACFSAGVPAMSSYTRWLSSLKGVEPYVAEAIASALLPAGATPFISALPQAALANPEGPLAVMGHVDLAWSYSFKDEERSTGLSYFSVLKALAAGSRVGVALGALMRGLADTSLELAMLYEQRQNQRSLLGGGLAWADEESEPAQWAGLWMQHKDLSNFILLGDPAVRLPFELSLSV